MRKHSEMRACKLSLYNTNTFEIKRFGNSSHKSSKSLTELHSNLMPSNILVDPVSQEKLAGQNGDQITNSAEKRTQIIAPCFV